MLFLVNYLFAGFLGRQRDRFWNSSHYSFQLCVVEGQQTLIYVPGLPTRNPLVFALAWFLSRCNGWRLLRDRRRSDGLQHDGLQPRRPVTQERRVSSPVAISLKMVLAVIAMKAVPALSGTPVFLASSDTNATIVTQLAAVRSASLLPVVSTSEFNATEAFPYFAGSVSANPGRIPADDIFASRYQQALALLNRHWRKGKADPENLADDIAEVAAYLAGREQSFDLLMSLEGKRWSLNYQQGQFRTDVRGNAFTVNSVRIYFDPRTAAMLKNHQQCEVDAGHCIASPADALIHELIHAQIALLDTGTFLRQGGMNGVVYPYQHERDVIGRESKIYAAMSSQDSRKRPFRTAHTGQLLPSDCATCIGS